MLLCAGVVVVVIGVLWVTVPRLVVGGVGGGVDIAVGFGGVGVADGDRGCHGGGWRVSWWSVGVGVFGVGAG